ncbi:hypothetical protein BC829DRAFT_396123 [Chytridium lagenaria]|nr:hypothetical protein BC829DRAFT_396123 [Chytridium lagenaria]
MDEKMVTAATKDANVSLDQPVTLTNAVAKVSKLETPTSISSSQMVIGTSAVLKTTKRDIVSLSPSIIAPFITKETLARPSASRISPIGLSLHHIFGIVTITIVASLCALLALHFIKRRTSQLPTVCSIRHINPAAEDPPTLISHVTKPAGPRKLKPPRHSFLITSRQDVDVSEFDVWLNASTPTTPKSMQWSVLSVKTSRSVDWEEWKRVEEGMDDEKTFNEDEGVVERGLIMS